MFIVKTDITWKSHFCIILSRQSSIQNCLHSMLSHPKSVLGSCRHIVNICWMNDHHWYESTVQRKGSIPKVNSVSFIWVGLRVILGGFLGGSVVKKKSGCNAEDTGVARSLIPGSGRSPGGRHGNPLQYSCLGEPCGQSLAGYSP